MNIDIGDFVQRYEHVYGDIRNTRQQFVKVYNAYCDKMGYRVPIQTKTRYIHNGRVMIDVAIKYTYSQWGPWNWDNYAYYTRIPNHTSIEYDSMIMDRTITMLHNKYIHEECTGVIALKTIIK